MNRTHSLLLSLTVAAFACRSGETPPPQDFNTDTTTASGPAAAAVARVVILGKAGPVDQGGYFPDMLALRNELLAIAERRDTLALYRVIAPDIRVSFGGDAGIEGLHTVWQIQRPESEFWATLTDVLIHGGRHEGDERFVAPWTFGAIPDSIDAFGSLIIRDVDVPVFSEADSASERIGTLAYDIVRAGPYEEGAPFRAVALVDGGVAYVHARNVRSPVDHRAIFERRNGRWMLIAFIAGD